MIPSSLFIFLPQSQRQWHHSNIMFGILMRKCNHVTKITTDLGVKYVWTKLFSGMSCNGVSYLMVYCILLSLPRVVDWGEFWCKMCLQWRLGRCRFPLALLHLALRMNARWYVALVPLIIASQICSNTQPLKVQGFKTTVWPIIGYCLCLWDKNTRVRLCKSPERVGGAKILPHCWVGFSMIWLIQGHYPWSLHTKV